MSRPVTPSTKPASSSRSHREDVLQFLDDLDSLEGGAGGGSSTSKDGTSSLSSSRIAGGAGAPTSSASGKGLASNNNTSNNDNASLSNRGASRSTAPSPAAAAAGDKADDPQAVLDFLDEIVSKRERRSATPVNASASTADASSSSAGKKGVSSATSTTTSGASVSRSGSRTTLREGEGGSTAASRSSAAGIPTRKSTESARSINMTSLSPAGQAAEKLQEAVPLASEQSSSSSQQPASSGGGGGGGWGWGSVWSQASSVLQQAKTVAEEQAKHLPKNLPTSITNLQNQLPVSPSTASTQAQAGMNAASAQAQKWRSGMMNMLSTQLDIEKLRKDIADTGMKAMQDIMNAVAPPIAEHEVIQVNLSHDMIGYEGVETLVYRALAKVMEQVEGGDLVVNKGHVEDSPSNAQKQPSQKSELGLEDDDDDDERNLNTVEGFVEGYKLAEANLEALIKKHYQKPAEPQHNQQQQQQSPGKSPTHGRKESAGVSLPVTVCPVYMRIQPVIAAMPFATTSTSSTTPSTTTPSSSNEQPQTGATMTTTRTSDDLHLYFVMILRDPTNELVHKTLSQSMPSKWLDIPFEENEWVEDIMVDVIRRGVEIIGEEYIKGRMHGRLLKNAKAETIFEDETDEQVESAENATDAVEKTSEA